MVFLAPITYDNEYEWMDGKFIIKNNVYHVFFIYHGISWLKIIKNQ